MTSAATTAESWRGSGTTFPIFFDVEPCYLGHRHIATGLSSLSDWVWCKVSLVRKVLHVKARLQPMQTPQKKTTHQIYQVTLRDVFPQNSYPIFSPSSRFSGSPARITGLPGIGPVSGIDPRELQFLQGAPENRRLQAFTDVSDPSSQVKKTHTKCGRCEQDKERFFFKNVSSLFRT